MKRPTFYEGVAVALITSLAGSVLYSVAAASFNSTDALRIIIALSALAYIAYLFSRSRERTGRISMLSAWAIAASLLWFLQPSMGIYLLAHIGMIWLIRSLHFYSSIVTSLADLGLSAAALLAALWAAAYAGSLFLSLWCFFLVQALFTAIPERITRRSESIRNKSVSDPFERAQGVAESALRKLTPTHIS